MRRVETRLINCTMCAKPVVVKSLKSPHPESPEMLATGAWIGFSQDVDEQPELVVACSELCAQRLLAE